MLFKKIFYLLFAVSLSGSLLTGCNKNEPDTNDNAGQSDNTGNQDEFGTFTFTARGETVTCTPSENQAAFIHDFHGGNYLTISGINRELPTNKIYSIGVSLIIQGELKPGAYSFVGPEPFANCLDEGAGCDGVCQGVVIANKLKILPDGTENPDLTADKKALTSTGGTLKITAVSIGTYVNGFAEGKISGEFSFSGTNLFEITGNANGKFENIPLISTK